MNRLSILALLFLFSCDSFVPYTPSTPSTYYTSGNTYAFYSPDGPAICKLSPNQQVLVIGAYQDWRVVEKENTRFLIPTAGLSPSPLDSSMISDRYILAHGLIKHGSFMQDSARGGYMTPAGW
jgi:hypothetical protein